MGNEETTGNENEEETTGAEEPGGGAEESSVEEFALRNTCKKVAKSKTSGLRACVHY